jgi:drug/metabolite transporter (DMT)-like permease
MEQWIAFFVIFLAYIFHQREGFRSLNFSKEVVFLLVSTLFWGISYVFFLIPIKLFGVLYFSLILEFCVLISCIVLLIFKEKRILPPKIDSKTLFICSLIGLVICVGSVLSNLSLTQLPVYVNITIAICFELLTIFYGLFKLKENLAKQDWILIAGVSFGVVLMMV